jgi:hypothetical protein
MCLSEQVGCMEAFLRGWEGTAEMADYQLSQYQDIMKK